MDGLAGRFADFFKAIHGNEPFEWQKRLAQQVLDGDGWPDVIRVPTGCGKTSTLDLALFELAMRGVNYAARRICFVIDRRLVVDEVTEHAHRLYAAISGAHGSTDGSVLAEVATRLGSIAADAEAPLRVVRLRGGVYCDDGWAADPLTPTILISTVDQIGSRLLFRGYGVSRRSRPVHAGLLAFDTRIILDEAHLSTVFSETLDRIRQYQQWAELAPLDENRRISIVQMSATAGEAARVFPASPADWREMQDERLKVRLEASKPAELIEVTVETITKKMRQEQPRKARELEKENRKKLVKHLVDTAKEFAGVANGAAEHTEVSPVVGVVVNRVATARQVFQKLQDQGDNEPDRDVILLTGRIRPYDRDRLLDHWLPMIRAKRARQPDRPLFVVATQTVEVGANLDFDVLVTEAAPLDALRQRFGRLYRIPDQPEHRPPAKAAVVIRSDQKSNSQDDPIYGQSIAETWKWLNQRDVASVSGRGANRSVVVDFGINHLDPKLPQSADDLRPMLAPQPEAPILFPAHLDAWVQTNPTPDPDPDVAPFLHGRADSPADVLIVWRADLDAGNRKHWKQIVSLMPPRTREALPVPVYEAQAWLRRSAEADIADVEGVPIHEARPTQEDHRRALRWRGRDDSKIVGPEALRPGDTIVVPASYGGADQFGWNPPSDDPVSDVADICLSQLVASYPEDAFRRPKLRIRLHPSLWSPSEMPNLDETSRQNLGSLLNAVLSAATAEDQDSWPAVQRLLAEVRKDVEQPAYAAAIDALLIADPQVTVYPDHSGVVLVAAAAVTLPDHDESLVHEAEEDEPQDDDGSLIAGGRRITLADHTNRVRDTTRRFAEQCGLSRELIAALTVAAQWHDEGKRDRRFQAWLHGSELQALAALGANQPLAKSGRDPKRWGSSLAYGYPKKSRHEFVSVRLFEQSLQGSEEDGLLVKLLIGTHHGYGRPWAQVLTDRRPVQVTTKHEGRTIETNSDHRLYEVDSGWTDLFWHMVRRYSWWGLAYLESIMVTADRLVSAREQRQPLGKTEEPAA